MGRCWPSLAGVPFAAMGLLPLLFVSQQAALAGLAAATLAMYAGFLPVAAMVAASFSRGAMEVADLPLTPRRYVVLLLLWLTTDGTGIMLSGGAAVARSS